jgi:hypothetical protein
MASSTAPEEFRCRAVARAAPKRERRRGGFGEKRLGVARLVVPCLPKALLGETAQRRAARTLAGSLLLTVADLRAHPPLLATLFAAALTRLLRTQVQPALRGVANRVAGPAGVYRGGNAVRRPRAPHGSGSAGEAASADVGRGPGERGQGAVSSGAVRIVATLAVFSPRRARRTRRPNSGTNLAPLFWPSCSSWLSPIPTFWRRSAP